jgi:hypothetical protein
MHGCNRSRGEVSRIEHDQMIVRLPGDPTSRAFEHEQSLLEKLQASTATGKGGQNDTDQRAGASFLPGKPNAT